MLFKNVTKVFDAFFFIFFIYHMYLFTRLANNSANTHVRQLIHLQSKLGKLESLFGSAEFTHLRPIFSWLEHVYFLFVPHEVLF